jgi:hypothetical protein
LGWETFLFHGKLNLNASKRRWICPKGSRVS